MTANETAAQEFFRTIVIPAHETATRNVHHVCKMHIVYAGHLIADIRSKKYAINSAELMVARDEAFSMLASSLLAALSAIVTNYKQLVNQVPVTFYAPPIYAYPVQHKAALDELQKMFSLKELSNAK